MRLRVLLRWRRRRRRRRSGYCLRRRRRSGRRHQQTFLSCRAHLSLCLCLVCVSDSGFRSFHSPRSFLAADTAPLAPPPLFVPLSLSLCMCAVSTVSLSAGWSHPGGPPPTYALTRLYSVWEVSAASGSPDPHPRPCAPEPLQPSPGAGGWLGEGGEGMVGGLVRIARPISVLAPLPGPGSGLPYLTLPYRILLGD